MAYRDDFRQVERDGWWSFPRVIAAVLVLMIVFYGIGFLATGGDLAIYRFWAPKQADAQREVFEHSQSFIEGKVQNIGQLCYAESQAEGNQKMALDSEIRNEAATISAAKLPTDERACVDRAKGL